MDINRPSVVDDLLRRPSAVIGPWLKAAMVLGVLAIGFVVYRAYREAQDESAWSALARARQTGMSIEALEGARTEGRGSAAEPWINFHLAFALFDEGGLDNLGRAREVALLTLDEHPSHTAVEMLKSLVLAIESYQGAS